MPLSSHISSGVGVEMVDVRGFQMSARKCERGGDTCRSPALVLETDILNEKIKSEGSENGAEWEGNRNKPHNSKCVTTNHVPVDKSGNLVISFFILLKQILRT